MQHWRGGLARMRTRKLRAIYLIMDNFKRYQRRKFVSQLSDAYRWEFFLLTVSETRFFSRSLFPWTNFAVFESQFPPRIFHRKSQRFHQLLSFTSSLNVCSQFVSSVMPSLHKVVCQWGKMYTITSARILLCVKKGKLITKSCQFFLCLIAGTANILVTLASPVPHPLLPCHVKNSQLTPSRSLKGKTKYFDLGISRKIYGSKERCFLLSQTHTSLYLYYLWYSFWIPAWKRALKSATRSLPTRS